MSNNNNVNKNDKFPCQNTNEICYIKNCITRKNIIVGDYTYYHDRINPTNFEKHVTHHYPFIGDKLIIGNFTQIGEGTKFIMNGANHYLDAISTYPFYIFGKNWSSYSIPKSKVNLKGDTIIGNDVWIGENVTFLPGVKVGDGAIIGANSTVASDIEPYTIVAGNPAKFIRKRFNDKIINHLLKIKWWNWPIEKINENVKILSSENFNDLFKLK